MVIDLIHGEESEEANMNGHQPRHTWTSEEKANLSNFPAFLCPIMMEPLQDPVVAKDGHTYSSAALKQWLSANGTSPTTREYIANDAVIRNFALQAAMEEVAHYSAETKKRLTKCDEKENMSTKAMNLMKTMLQSETAKVNTLENKIQMMTKERDNNDLKNANIAKKIQTEADTKWKLVLEKTQNNFDMENARLLASYDKATNENKKLVDLNSGLSEKLKKEQEKRKSMVDKMKEMVGENEMVTKNPKASKKAKR